MEQEIKIVQPGKFQAIVIMQLVLGIIQILFGLSFIAYTFILGIFTYGFGCLLMPLGLYYLILGVLSTISGIRGRSNNPVHSLYKPVSIMNLIPIISCDIVSFGCGLTSLIFLSEPEVIEYLKK